MILALLLPSLVRAEAIRPQVVGAKPQVAEAPAMAAPGLPVVGAPVAAAPTGRPVQIPVTAIPQKQQQQQGQDQTQQQMMELLSKMQQLEKMQHPGVNGAGPTGSNWSTGVPSGAPGSTGARGMPFDLNGSGQCGAGQDLWRAAGAVMNEGVIPPGQGYNINAPNWPKMVGTAPNQLRCEFSPGKTSMCTSATAAAICQHFADLSNSGKIQLSQSQVNFLNGPQVRAAINGNTFSVAYLFQHLGGSSLHGKGQNIRSVLAQAKTGDVLRLDRTNGTGHSTIFKEIKGDQFCYWTSNTGTNGVGVQCENLSSLTQVVVSRFPSNLSSLPGKLDHAAREVASLNSSRANAMQASSVNWASGLECRPDSVPTHTPASVTPPSNTPVANR